MYLGKESEIYECHIILYMLLFISVHFYVTDILVDMVDSPYLGLVVNIYFHSGEELELICLFENSATEVLIDRPRNKNCCFKVFLT